MKPLAALALLLLAGCATKPTPTNIVNTRSYALPFDEVWTKVVGLLATNNIQIKTIEKDSGVIYAEPAQANKSFADCGSDIGIPVSRPGSMNILVRQDGQLVAVSVNTIFKEIRQFDTATYSVDCYSTGLLETMILEAIGPAGS